MQFIYILSRKYLHLVYISSSSILQYVPVVHLVRVRQGGGWGRNGYHVTRGLAELIVFCLPNYGEG